MFCVSQVWWTADGAVWTCATSAAAFGVRAFHVLLTFSGQMWLIGGAGSPYYYNDVWGSTDGVQWVVQAPLPTSYYLQSFAAVVVNSSILTTGASGSTEFRTISVCLAAILETLATSRSHFVGWGRGGCLCSCVVCGQPVCAWQSFAL